jgi:hypothetical protein
MPLIHNPSTIERTIAYGKTMEQELIGAACADWGAHFAASASISTLNSARVNPPTIINVEAGGGSAT